MTSGSLDIRQDTTDQIAAMNAFVRVVEAGSFTKAADSLNIPRPTLTRLIQALEDELKVRLLQRSTRALTVTAEGASYYGRVVRLLADLDDIESTARQSLAKPSGRIRVDTPPALGTQCDRPGAAGLLPKLSRHRNRAANRIPPRGSRRRERRLRDSCRRDWR
jgi:DNA-binding transcriptional LysR family regulator